MQAASALLDEFRPGRMIYIPGATGQSAAVIDALRSEPDRLAGVHVVGCYVPGMNEFDYAALHPRARLSTFMLPRAMQASFEARRISLIGCTYFGAARALANWPIDVAIAQVSPPGPDGCCSLGIASDFAPLVWSQARRRVLVVNPVMPSMPRGPRLAVADADLIVEGAGPLVTASVSADSASSEMIARRVAELIPDGAHLQAGIGGAPGAIWPHLRGHRQLVLRSGMANDGFRALVHAGALAPHGHLVGIAYGSQDFYSELAREDWVAFATTRETHDSAALSALPRLHAVNSALEVDLFGQVNVEWQGDRLSSGVGGAPDFMRAALASDGGRSILALPATARGGTTSRIVLRCTAPSIGMARSDLDTVVTEYGVAEVRDLGLDARAEALISVAAPEFRDGLADAWHTWRSGRVVAAS